jgi:formylglycine-generating enzyme required for sulfatase activity
MISHADALAFCEYLSQRDGMCYRLPTEAEWEYAARGGIEGAPHPWGFEPADSTRGNFEHSSGVPVANYPPNNFGLFEMVGNFREWTSDIFVDDAYAKTPPLVTDPHVTQSDDTTLDPSGNPLYAVRSGVAGLPYCVNMMRCALRMAGPDASLRLVVTLDE